MKEWVIGNPYTSRVVLDDNDKFLILACDGVSKIIICLPKKKKKYIYIY